MDENEITEGLRGITLVEPPLGFVPDDVATRAARRQRDRRFAIAAGAAVTVVAVAAVAFAANATDSGAGRVGGSTEPPSRDLHPQIGRAREHLQQVIGGVLPNASDIRVRDFEQSYTGSPDAWQLITGEATFRDDAGPAYFTLTISGPHAAGIFTPLADRCDPTPVDFDGNPVVVPTLPNGKPLRCEKLPQPDGSTVVLEQTGVAIGATGTTVRPAGLDAMHYRTDGSIVGIVNDDLISGRLAEEYDATIGQRPRPPLTEQQLIALVTDPAFTLD